MWYVSEYLVTRHYGGPEEGGWWFDNSEHIRVVGEFKSEDEASDFADECDRRQREGQKPGHRDRFSVRPTDVGDTVFYLEEKPGEFEDMEPRRYE